MPKHNKVCHGDFWPSNIIISAENTPYIIDWSHATQGNASADAAVTYLLFSLIGNKQSAGRYLDMYCRKTGTSDAYVKSWLPIVAASRIADAARGVKENRAEREFLLSWVNILDH
jgi:aminoglycoside phosphotransferase (APT) family kinase protein